MADTTYNGWTNRVTWLVNLWMGEDILEEQRQLDAELDTITLSEFIRNMVDRTLEDHTAEAAFISDLVHDALDDVNWQEILDNLKG